MTDKDTGKFRHLDLFSTSYSKHKQLHFNDAQKENTLSNKTDALTKIMNIYMWAIGTLNQQKRFLYSNQIFKKMKVSGKSPFFVIGPFCTSHSICPFALHKICENTGFH